MAMISYEYKIELFTNEASLNKLGREGWDLVCPGGKDGNYLVFKRPIGAIASMPADSPGKAEAAPVAAKPKKKSYKDFL